GKVDLTSKEGVMGTPYYYLQQNDIVYVEPNKYKAQTSEINQNRNFWLSVTSTLVSVATLIITITKIPSK
ncbi:MAG: polysaccharide export protein, partial [Alistipes sp.]|nr:polysaccharide export protein [Alistipes sp.]